MRNTKLGTQNAERGTRNTEHQTLNIKLINLQTSNEDYVYKNKIKPGHRGAGIHDYSIGAVVGI